MKRLFTGLIFGIAAFACIVEGHMALLIFLAVIAFFGAKEYVKILNNKGFYPSLGMIYIAQILFAAVAYFQRFDLVSLITTVSVAGAFMWILFRGRQPYIANVATTVLGMAYCGWFPFHLLFLRNLGSGFDALPYVLMMFIAVLTTDTGCYYVGCNLGRHKLAPVISPNKTVEGAIGGAICAVIITMIIGYYAGISWYMSLFIGLLCTACAQIGDLCESLIKRDAGVKDSGDILPGHGGFMDRCDSYIFTIPVMCYFCKYFVFSNDFVTSIFGKGLF